MILDLELLGKKVSLQYVYYWLPFTGIPAIYIPTSSGIGMPIPCTLRVHQTFESLPSDG